MTILVIDDDHDIREALATALEEEGYTVRAAADGREALDLLDRAADELPAVIVLDLQMPMMDGFAFRERQLAHARAAAVPVIVFTAGNALDPRIPPLKAARVFAKPAELGRLLDAVEALAGSAPPRSNAC